MRIPAAPGPQRVPPGPRGTTAPLIQREKNETGEEMEEQEEEEEAVLRAKADPGRAATVRPDIQGRIQSFKGSGLPLPRSTRRFFESRLGHDFSNVRIHTGPYAAETARSMNARAFTLGQDVVFGAGQYAPETAVGRQLLAHELVHVLQCYSVNPKRSLVAGGRDRGPAREPWPRRPRSGRWIVSE